MDPKRQKLSPGNNDVQKECQEAIITALESKLVHVENKLKLVTAELEQVKEEQAHDKIHFETEKCEMNAEIDKHQEQCTELQSKNERLHKYLQDNNINIAEESLINLCNTDLTKVEELNDDAFDSLPDEIILRIFFHLRQNQLGQIGRVCKRWKVLTKSAVLWKNVDVKFHWSHGSQNTVSWCFVKMLPPCVTRIRINFSQAIEGWDEQLNFEELCVRLQRRCPCLKTLILKGALLSYNLHSIIDLCTHFLKDVKILVFLYSRFLNCRLTGECNEGGISKIEILDITDCDFHFESFDSDFDSDLLDYDYINKPPFSRMPYLKQLHLSETNISDCWFEDDFSFLNQLHVLNLRRTSITFRIFPTLQNHGLNLKDLYLCEVDLQVPDLNFNNSVFPHLETICLRECYVRCEPIISLIQSCQSLQNVYVSDNMANIFAEHPIVFANRRMSGIVKAIGPYHNHNVDYFDN